MARQSYSAFEQVSLDGDSVWRLVSELEGWASWWPDGAPATTGALTEGAVLEWPAADADRNRATVIEVRPTEGKESQVRVRFESTGSVWWLRVQRVTEGFTNLLLSVSGAPFSSPAKGFLAGPRREAAFTGEIKRSLAALGRAASNPSLRASARFFNDAKEPFLRWGFVANLRESEAVTFDYAHAQAEQIGGHQRMRVPYAIVARFPRVCSGCLEPSARSEPVEAVLTSSASTVSGGIVTNRSEVSTVLFEVPLCERCDSYGLRGLMRVYGHTIENAMRKEDMGTWVHLKFPNLA